MIWLGVKCAFTELVSISLRTLVIFQKKFPEIFQFLDVFVLLDFAIDFDEYPSNDGQSLLNEVSCIS